MKILGSIALLALACAAFCQGPPPPPPGASGYVLKPNTPTGGTAVGHDLNGTTTTINYVRNSSGYGAGNGGNAGALASGSVTYYFIWNGIATAQKPASVIVTVTSSASWTGQGGSCDNGYGDHVNNVSPPYPPGLPPYMGSCSGTHYVLINNPGSGFTLTLTPQASCSAGSAACNVNMTVTDVVVGVAGTLMPGDTPQALPGQRMTSSISAGSFTVDGWNWSVSGTAYKSVDWGSPSPTQHAWVPNTIFNQATLSAFTPLPGTLDYHCSANVHCPDGSIKAVNGDRYVDIISPDYDLALVPGTTRLVGPATAPTQISCGDKDAVQGMTFKLSVVTPQPFLTSQGGGKFSTAQLCSIEMFQQRYVYPNRTASSGGYKLDNSFPYHTVWDATPPKVMMTDGDSPSWDLFTGLGYTVSFTITNDFKTFLIYQPPPSSVGTSEWVTPAACDWHWHTSGAIGSGGTWPAPTGNPTAGAPYGWPYGDFTWNGIYHNS